jgi:signal transduction histidine kinase
MTLDMFIYSLMGKEDSELVSKRQKKFVIQAFFVIALSSLFPVLTLLTLIENETLFANTAKPNVGVIFFSVMIAVILFLVQRLTLQSWQNAKKGVRTLIVSMYIVLSLILSILLCIIFFSSDIKTNLKEKQADKTEMIIEYMGYYKDRDSLSSKYRQYNFLPDSALYYAKEIRFLDEKINSIKNANNTELHIQFSDSVRAFISIVKKNEIVLFAYLLLFLFCLAIYATPLLLQYSMLESVEAIKAEKMNSTATQVELFSMIQHELGNKIPSLNLDLQDIFSAYRLSENEKGISLKTHIREPLPGENINSIDTIENVLNRMKDKIEYSSTAISNLAGIITSSPARFKPVKTRVLKFLQTEASKHVRDSKHLQLRFEGDDSIELEIDTKQFSFLLQNFISNAVNHGFAEQAGPHFILFKLFKQKDEIVLQIINNGKSFPASFTIEEFKKPYHYTGLTGNTGLGGYIIANVLQNHNATIKLIDLSGEDSSFKVCFEIIFNSNRRFI